MGDTFRYGQRESELRSRRNHRESKVRRRYRSRRFAQRKNKSIPLLTRLILSLGPVRSRGISSTSCCTFGGRAQPICGDYSVSHPVSNLFSPRPASSKHTNAKRDIPLQGTGLARQLTSYHCFRRHGWYRECQHQFHARSPCCGVWKWQLACWHWRNAEGLVHRRLQQ